MPHHHQSHRRAEETPNLSETKAHIFLAGHELLKAAEGVLKFCKSYAEQTSAEKPHPNVVEFFTKAIKVAGDLGSSMVQGTGFKEMAGRVTRPFCDTIEREIRRQKRTKNVVHKTVKKGKTK